MKLEFDMELEFQKLEFDMELEFQKLKFHKKIATDVDYLN